MSVCSSCGREDTAVRFCSACGRELLCGVVSEPCPVEGCLEHALEAWYDTGRTEEQKVAIWGEDAFVEPRSLEA